MLDQMIISHQEAEYICLQSDTASDSDMLHKIIILECLPGYLLRTMEHPLDWPDHYFTSCSRRSSSIK